MQYDDYITKTKLILPFRGLWKISNGGRNPEKNGHREHDNSGPENQRFAYDFIKDHKNEGKSLSDYEAFGADVLSPGKGTVVQVVTGNHDVPIGEEDWVNISGNMVIIDHENGEWSVLCHLQHNSILVRVGQQVLAGELIGKCGNSGNTSEPHIHYHLQDSSEMYKGVGLPIQFSEIIASDKRESDFEPEGDMWVSNV